MVDVKQSDQRKLNYWKGDFAAINAALLDIQWEEILKDRLVEDQWHMFKNKILELAEKHIPVRKENGHEKNRWISKETINVMKERRKGLE